MKSTIPLLLAAFVFTLVPGATAQNADQQYRFAEHL
jgi:hypothetical protein